MADDGRISTVPGSGGTWPACGPCSATPVVHISFDELNKIFSVLRVKSVGMLRVKVGKGMMRVKKGVC